MPEPDDVAVHEARTRKRLDEIRRRLADRPDDPELLTWEVRLEDALVIATERRWAVRLGGLVALILNAWVRRN
jgi:hypothetical protein